MESPNGTWLLYRQSLNPFSQRDVVYGATLGIANDQRDTVHLAVAELFAINGGREVPLLSCLRSYVFTGDEKGLNADLQDYFFSAVASMDALDLAAERDAIRRNWCRPWDLATEQSNRALAQLTHERTALPLRATDGTPGASTITRQVFDQWWFLVYESDHAVACFEQMRAAWDGAIELHKNSGGLLRAMP